jgi:long-chain acyl-CoA synthetase
MRPNKLALICRERSLTYAELNARANCVANAFRSLGVQAGDRVAVMVYNSLEGFEIGAGLAKLAAVNVPVNYRLREHEVAYIVNDSGAKVVVAGPESVEVVELARAEVKDAAFYIAIGGKAPADWLLYEELLERDSENPPAGSGASGLTMNYTSGTTGNPKGLIDLQGYQRKTCYESSRCLMGATVVVLPKFDPIEALRLCDQHRVTNTFMAPTLLQRLCDVPEESALAFDTSTLKTIILGAAPCPYSLKVRAAERFGQRLWEFYGATDFLCLW